MRQFRSERLDKLNKDVEDSLAADDDPYVSTVGQDEYIQALTSIT